MKQAQATVSMQADLAASRLANGYLRFYDGPRPESADLPISPKSLMLAEAKFGTPPKAIRGSVTIPLFSAPIQRDGTPRFFRAFDQTNQPVLDGSVGKSGEASLSSLAWQAGGTLRLKSLTYILPAGNGEN